MAKIQVVALNDDNHSRSYVTADRHLGDAADFMMQCLLRPHTDEYEVREVYICDPLGKLAELTEDEFLYMFDLLDCNTDVPALQREHPEVWKNRQIAFNLFWEEGDTWSYA